MLSSTERMATASTLPLRIANIWQRRMSDAMQRWVRAQRAPDLAMPANPWLACWDYWTDAAERQVLFWDTLRQRGDNYLEHEKAGKPPLLHFDYEIIADGRTFERPV